MPVQNKPCYKDSIARYKRTELLVSIKGMKTRGKIMVYGFYLVREGQYIS